MSYTAAPVQLPVSPVVPVMYKIKGQLIPANLTLQERATYIKGLGAPPRAAELVAMQDFSASTIGLLLSIVRKSDDPDLITLANKAVTRWNTNCDSFLESR